MSFWQSSLGTLTGSPEASFARTFKQIPDNTTALAKIVSFINKEFNGTKYLQIDWEIISGNFRGQHVFQKLYVFDQDEKKRFRILNLLMLIYKLFNVQPSSGQAPTDQELSMFIGKTAGIKIQETVPNQDGKQYNWVSEVHPAADFKTETGVRIEVTGRPESAFSRNPQVPLDLNDDLPF